MNYGRCADRPPAFGIWYLLAAGDRYQGPVRTLEEDEVTAGL